MRFLSQRARAIAADTQDLRHDVYVRVLEAARVARPASPQAFLFATARNLLIDRARRDRVVRIDFLDDLEALNVLVDNVSPERQMSGRQQLQRVSRLFDRLPGRCREVLWLRRIDGLGGKDVATRLGLAEATVEKHLFRALRLLADALYGSDRAHEGSPHERAEEHKREK